MIHGCEHEGCFVVHEQFMQCPLCVLKDRNAELRQIADKLPDVEELETTIQMAGEKLRDLGRLDVQYDRDEDGHIQWAGVDYTSDGDLVKWEDVEEILNWLANR